MNSIPTLLNEEALGGVILFHGAGKGMFEACANDKNFWKTN